MNQDPPSISVRELKAQIRWIVQRAENSPIEAMVELRKRLEEITVDIYQRWQSGSLSSAGSKPSILKRRAQMTAALEDANVLPHAVAKSAHEAADALNPTVHYGSKPAARDDLIKPLTNFLRLLKWYEREYPATPSIAFEPLANTTAVAEKGAPYANTTVILAERDLNSDIEEDWQGTRKYLASYGVRLVIDQSIPLEQPLSQDALFVQLFSALDPLEATKRRFENYRTGPVSARILQWRKTLPEQTIDSAVLDSLEPKDKDFCEAATVKTGPIEEFKQQLLRQLDIIRSPRERPYLYIAFDRSNKNDDDYAARLNEVAREIADVRLIAARNPGSDFVRALKKVTGFVFLYGDTDPAFIEDWMGRYIDGRRSLNNHLKLAALYEAPPRDQKRKNIEPKIGLRKDEWRKYGSRDQLVLDDIERYCSELRR
jgi:hypothetical protein